MTVARNQAWQRHCNGPSSQKRRGSNWMLAAFSSFLDWTLMKSAQPDSGFSLLARFMPVFVSVIAVLGALIVCPTVSASDYDRAMSRAQYRVYTGDVNGDGREDILMKSAPKIVMVPLDDDFEVPIPIPAPSPTFALVSVADGGYSLLTNPDTQLLGSTWKAADYGVEFGTAHGFADSVSIHASTGTFVVGMAAGRLELVDSPPPASTLAVVTYIHTDGLGSPVARTNSDGQLISRTRYEPYGATVEGATPTIGFTGHVHDSETGLVYMEQRYYDPVAGRFLSIDPVTTDANTGSSFNRYVYASNNPYKYIDPDGRADCTVDANGCKHYGSPQKTGTPGHDTASANVGAAMSEQGATEVHYNRSLAAVTGNPAAGGQRPDVAGVMPSGAVNTVEITSPSQTTASQAAKGVAMQGQLTAIGKGGTAQTISISQGLAVKGITALSILSAIPRAIDIKKSENSTGSKVDFVTGFGYMAGQLTREQVMQRVTCPTGFCI